MEESGGQLKRALIDASAGAISGGVSRTVTSPLDVIKIRFQVKEFLFKFVQHFFLIQKGYYFECSFSANSLYLILA